MRSSIVIAAALAGALGLAPSAEASRILVDFGQASNTTASPDSNGNSWNNTTGPVTTDLVFTDGGNSGFGIQFSTGFGSGANGALTAPSAGLLGDIAVASATGDYFFRASADMAFTINGLDPSKTYDLGFFGTRATGDERIVRYTATGAGTAQGVNLQVGGTDIGSDGAYDGNDDTLAALAGIAPDANGDILVDITAVSNIFVYLGALTINEVPTPATALAFGALGGLVLRRRR